MPGVLKQIVFYFLMAFLGFCAGMAVGSLFVPEGSGLAGPAIAFWYGLGGLIVGIILALILIRVLRTGFRIAFIIALIFSFAMVGWIVYRFIVITNKQSSQQILTDTELYHRKINSGIFHHAVFKDGDDKMPLGIGIAKPHLSDGKIIYFYHLLHIGSQPYQIRPVDSIRITKGKHHYEISYAPPWFFPESMKLDYDMLLLRTITISRDWLEVVINKQTGQTHWIAAADADFVDWSTFLLNVYDVELIDPEANPLRFKPLDNASIIATTMQGFSLRPLAICGDWMMVPTTGLADRILPYGWIRWRKDDQLLIRYSLLS